MKIQAYPELGINMYLHPTPGEAAIETMQTPKFPGFGLGSPLAKA
jgi:hypothetical protein